MIETLCTLFIVLLFFTITLSYDSYSGTTFPIRESGVPRFVIYENTNLDRWAFGVVTFSCKTAGGEKYLPQTKWFKNGKELDSEFYRIHGDRYFENKKEQSLTIKELRNEDVGSYLCNVSNRAGFIVRQYSLDIINYCDLYASPNYEASHLIPVRCLCLWYIKFGCRRKGVDWSQFDTKQCQGYDSRSKLLISPEECVEDFDFYKESRKRKEMVQSTTTSAPEEFVGISLKSHESPHGSSQQLAGIHVDNENERNKRIIEVERDYKEKLEDRNKIRRVVNAGDWSAIAGKQNTGWDQAAKPSNERSNDGVLRFTDGKGNHVPKVIPSGHTVKLECKYEGPPGTGVVWRKGDELLPPGNQRPIGKPYIIKSYALEIQNPVPTDSGQYSCEVYYNNSIIKRTFSLTVRDVSRSKPFILPNVLVNQTTNINDTVEFSCQVFNPPTTTSMLSTHFMWTHLNNHSALYTNITDGTIILNITTIGENDHTHSNNYGDHSILTISNVSKVDEGYYVCIAGNSIGQDVAYAYLQVNEVTDEESSSSLFIILVSIGSSALLILGLFVIWLMRFYCNEKAKNQIGQLEQFKGPERKKVVITKKMPKPGDDDSGALSAYHVQFFPLSSTNRRRQATSGRQPLYSDLTLHMTEYIMEPDPEWEIDRSRLKLIKQLGEGAFGEVWKAALTLSDGSYLATTDGNSEDTEMLVAVKKLKPNAQDKEMDDLIREMITFQNIGQHDNILRLIGCSTQKGPLFVVLELCKYGNLRDFLRAHRPRDNEQPQDPKENDGYLQARKPSMQHSTSVKDGEIVLINPLTLRHLVQFAWQVARGMQYMTSRKIIHRDLAARNVLVADNYVLKISDFGLSRDVHYNDYYRKKGNGRLPIKWMALEALDSHVYTVYSDVWSFGILLWEIITLGGTPYPSIAMQQLYSCLKEGYRMEAPDNCPEEIYNAMIACWQEDPKQRPNFDVLVDYFDWMLNQSASEQERYLDLKSTTEVENNSFVENMSSMLTEPSASLKKLRTRPLSEPIIHSPAPINDYEENSNEENESSSLLNGEKVIYCATVKERKKPSYAVLRRPTVCTEKTAESKTASVDSAIGSPAWQLEAETPLASEKILSKVLINENNENETAPLLATSTPDKRESFSRPAQQYYNCNDDSIFQEPLSSLPSKSYGVLKSRDSEMVMVTKPSAGASSLFSSPPNDVFISEQNPPLATANDLAKKNNEDGGRAPIANERHRRFSDDSSSSGRGSGTSTEGFCIEQYCTNVKNTSPSSELFPFTPTAFSNSFSSKCNPHEMKFFT